MVDEQEEARQLENTTDKTHILFVLLQWGLARWTKLALIAGLIYRIVRMFFG